MVQNEIKLHAAALRLLRVACPDCVTFHIPNGGKRSPETARLMKALGTTAGIFDLCLIDPDGRFFFLEAKTDKGRLSEAQEWFRKELIIRGVPYVVFNNLDQIRDFIRAHNIPNRLAQ